MYFQTLIVELVTIRNKCILDYSLVRRTVCCLRVSQTCLLMLNYRGEEGISKFL